MHFHRAQALLWQQDFSLERNERANVLQVGFIKLRPGTLVLALHNYHVTKPGRGEMLTFGDSGDEETLRAAEKWRARNVSTQTHCARCCTSMHILHPQLRFNRRVSLLSDVLFKTK